MTENKPIIIDEIDVSGCEFYNTDDKTCREVSGKYDTDICEFDKCENSNCYFKQLKRSEAQCEGMFVSHTDLEKKYKAKEQECEELKRQHESDKGLITNAGKQNYQLIQEYDQLKTEEQYLKQCCIKAGEELAKNSFAWDGKEKNLVIQAMELNEKFDQLKAENKDLKDEIRLIHDDCKGCSTCFNALESARIYCVENQKLKQTLTEIKEITETISEPMGTGKSVDRVILARQILQKISEVE